MTLLAPLALWGLIALGVPVLLHLRRRRVGRTIQVGSLKHLETLPTAERRGPRVRDPLRLLLRLAIIGLVVVVLAGPIWSGRLGEERKVILADSSAAPTLLDSLAKVGDLVVADLSIPWNAIARVDDSLPPGIPLTIAATTSIDRFSGPRPSVRRKVEWIGGASAPVRGRHLTAAGTPHSVQERRALDAAIAATAEILGTPGDTAGWEGRLPNWWRDSLATAAFPVAVARALIPARALPPPTELAIEQITPVSAGEVRGGRGVVDLHWWIWGLAVLLFLIERIWARHLERGS